MPDRPLKIFLDANVVIRAGKPPGAPLMPRVADLVNAGHVKILTTDLTKMEVAKKHASNDFEIIGSLARKRFRELTEETLGVKLPKTTPEDLRRNLFDKYLASTERMFETLKAETLSIDDVRAMTVFESYSREIGIFSGDAKKNQFPDAFIFEALRGAATVDESLVIVADDSDFDALIKDAPHVTRIKTISALFEKLGLAVAAAPFVEKYLEDIPDELVANVGVELNKWGLQVSDIEDAEIDEQAVNSVTIQHLETFATAGEDDILAVGRLEMNVHISYNHPDWDTATYDSEDKVLLPHHHVSGETNVDIEADFTMTLKVDAQGKPTKIGDFSFDGDDFIWVRLIPSEYD